jgi:hypothetical protein
MSFYLDRINYFSGLAKADPSIRYQVTENGTPRNSFFSVSDEIQLLAALKENIAWPFVACFAIRANMANNDGSIFDKFTHTLRFYTKAVLNDSTGTFQHEAIEAAYDSTFDILEHWKRRILADSWDDDLCGPLENADINTFLTLKMDQFGDYFYGWQLTFEEIIFKQDYSIPEAGYWTE